MIPPEWVEVLVWLAEFNYDLDKMESIKYQTYIAWKCRKALRA